MYDLEKINKHLTELLKDLENLEKHKAVTVESLKKDLDLLWILERGIYLAIQNLFDLFAHIISAELNEKWESYFDIAETLLKYSIVDKDQYGVLIKMAGFRNRLSHEYLSLDNEVITDIVSNKLIDFYKFANLVKKHCNLI